MQVAALLGAHAYFALTPSARPSSVPHPFNKRYMSFRPLVYMSLVFGVVAIYLTLKAQGFALSAVFSLSGLLQVSRAMSLARYEEQQFVLPMGAKISQMYVFFASAVAGFHFALHKKRYRRFEYFLRGFRRC